MFKYNAKVERVVDGDTVDAMVDLGFSTHKKVRIRMMGINAPESRTRNLEEKAKGLAAKARLEELLDKVTVPDSFGHYGLEDTYIMWWCEHHKEGIQFKIKNLVVCENYKYRNNKHLTDFVAGIDRREEFKKIAEAGCNSEMGLWK